MSSRKHNLQNIADIKALSKKVLPSTLLERICSRVASRNTRFSNTESCEHSWKEKVRGACGLFDISGFSRLAAKLSNEEKMRSISTGEEKTIETTNIAADAVTSTNETTEDNKARNSKRRNRRESTIKALDEDIFRHSSNDLDSKANNREMDLKRGLL